MATTVDAPRVEYRRDTPYVTVSTPRISWVVRSDVPDWSQHAAELDWDAGTASGRLTLDGSDSVLVAWPFAELAPRQCGTLRVRVRGGDGWSEWSIPTAIAGGFLGEGEWHAQFLGLADPDRPGQPTLLRTEFEVADDLTRGTLYATARGAYQVEVNAIAVDAEILKPGWTPFNQRLVHETTDVTGLLTTGRNALGVVLAAGWYAESYGFGGEDRYVYGEQPSFAGQLLLEYADGTATWVASAADWQACGEGPWVSSGIYAGETYDAGRRPAGWSEPGFHSHGWSAPTVHPAGPLPTPNIGPAVRATARVPVKEVITSPSGRTLLDFGQNLVGRLEIRVGGPAGHTVTLRHAEVLEQGELSTRPLRRAAATDRYTLGGTGVETWQPSFTFHGFRYAEVENWPGEFHPSDVEAVVVGSDLVRTGWFECSDDLVNQLHSNVVWGMRGNFLYLPTDCPQRDERLGWTGDIQVFAPTASYLFDCNGFLASWLVDLAVEQSLAGGVPFVVPDVLDSASTPAAAWGDAATVVPWVLYQRFGDLDVLGIQYPSMKAWVDQILALAGERNLWEGGFQFGDWLDPDAPPEQPGKAKTDADLIASAYLYRSTDLLVRAAETLGFVADADHYRARAEGVRAAWLAEYVTPQGRVLSDSQTAYSLAVEFGLVTDPELRNRMGNRLSQLVRRNGYRIGTGFVGTSLVADALTHAGHLHEAGRLLFQTECPSWLYPVTMGATTVWERWDSMLPDGTVNPGEMTSFNHYAFGAIADWLHRVVGGLAPSTPGYRCLEVAPRPLPGLDWARTRHETPYGTASVAWRREGAGLTVHATVLANATAVVRLPGSYESFEVGSGDHEWVVEDTPLAASSAAEHHGRRPAATG